MSRQQEQREGLSFFPNRYLGGGFSLDPGVPGGQPGCNLQTPRPAPSPTLALRESSFAGSANPRHGSILGHGYVPLNEIYVAVPLRVLRSELSFYP